MFSIPELDLLVVAGYNDKLRARIEFSATFEYRLYDIKLLRLFQLIITRDIHTYMCESFLASTE